MHFSLVDVVAFLILTGLFASTFLIRVLLLRRAIFQVISILRHHDCVSLTKAKTLDELGLSPPRFRDRFSKLKDYKPSALRTLIHMGAVRITEDQRVCLIEENLVEELRR